MYLAILHITGNSLSAMTKASVKQVATQMQNELHGFHKRHSVFYNIQNSIALKVAVNT